MSTPGKVLVVLVALATIPYLFLFSLFYQRNTNWGKEMQRLETEVVKTREDAVKALDTLYEARKEITASQVRRDVALTELRSEIAHLNKQLSLNVERQERIRLQLESTQASTELTQKDIAHRTQEEADTKTALADTQKAVEELKADVGTKLTTLEGMRTKFLDTMERNRELVKQAQGVNPSSPPPRTRPASLRP